MNQTKHGSLPGKTLLKKVANRLIEKFSKEPHKDLKVVLLNELKASFRWGEISVYRSRVGLPRIVVLEFNIDTRVENVVEIVRCLADFDFVEFWTGCTYAPRFIDTDNPNRIIPVKIYRGKEARVHWAKDTLLEEFEKSKDAVKFLMEREAKGNAREDKFLPE